MPIPEPWWLDGSFPGTKSAAQKAPPAKKPASKAKSGKKTNGGS